MPVIGLTSIRAKSAAVANNIVNVKAQRAATAGSATGQAFAALLTPIDTSNLINSMFRRLRNDRHGWRAVVGYTAAYAFAVHNAKGTLKGQPRRHFGVTKSGVEFGGGTGNGNYWDPNAEPRFLEKGFEQNRGAIHEAVVRALRL
ncbi:hypothetical protein DDSR119_13 [Pseudomonas phage DDSR119]|nr:hypothetical protein DDSR119_13 [Pseudomonas phage DDSR119]